jgi:RimJ/RimL family protein N-acetyltransferase
VSDELAEEVNFRLAESSDGQPVLDLLKVLQGESDTFLVDSDLDDITGEEEAQQINFINHSRTNLMAVAEYGSELIGIVTVDNIQESVGEVGVAVLAGYQGYSIGTNLMELAIDWAKDFSSLDQLMLTVFSNNKPAIHVYDKVGFHVTNTLVEDGREAVKMVLTISDKSKKD